MDDVIVIGGGIVGAGAAYHLARAGAQVTLLDWAHPGQATAAGAGIIAPGTTFNAPTAYYSLGFHAAAHYETLLAQLAEDGESKTGYETVGLLHVATSEAEAERLPILLRLLEERQAAGFKNIGAVCLPGDQETPDGLPILGRVPQLENVLLATGHGASGLQLGPYSGALVAELAAGHMPELNLAPFAIERFQA